MDASVASFFEEFLVVFSVFGEVHAEVEEDASPFFLEVDLVSADTVRTVVNGEEGHSSRLRGMI